MSSNVISKLVLINDTNESGTPQFVVKSLKPTIPQGFLRLSCQVVFSPSWHPSLRASTASTASRAWHRERRTPSRQSIFSTAPPILSCSRLPGCCHIWFGTKRLRVEAEETLWDWDSPRPSLKRENCGLEQRQIDGRDKGWDLYDFKLDIFRTWEMM